VLSLACSRSSAAWAPDDNVTLSVGLYTA
jgi:hypothetical protein